MLNIINIQSNEARELINKQGLTLTAEQLNQSRPSLDVRRQVSHALVRSALSHIPDIQIDRHESGRPYLTSHQNPDMLPLISISHSGHWVAVMLSSPESLVTIDVEDMTLPRAHQKIIDHYFCESEKILIETEGLIGFYKVWTAKEAIAKNLDKTISSLLSIDIGNNLKNRPLDEPFSLNYLDHNVSLTQSIPKNTPTLMITVCERC
ncbi:MAG: 4'-phosphopantetheinyl transferase superfamily protein [Candidatus Paracaedibacteraceae bacterium]|nr:4'-phosphopantetheinyl transferase superfamily protein [Candidatus Paracaedibacteraceae bacterium]